MYTTNTTLVFIEQNDVYIDFYNTKNESHVDKKIWPAIAFQYLY